MVKYKCIFIIFNSILFSSFSQANSEAIESESELLESIKVFNSIIAAIENEPDVKTHSSIIDTIMNVRKTISILETERDSYFDYNLELGNDLFLKNHKIGNYTISYIKNIQTNEIYSLRYKYWFYEDVTPDETLEEKAKMLSNFFITRHYGLYSKEFQGYVGTLEYEGYKEYKEKHPNVNFNIFSSKEYNDQISYLNDPFNVLTYGFVCGAGGMSPSGLDIFARLAHYKQYKIIERLLSSPNPVARLYAVDGIEHLTQKGEYNLSEEIELKLNSIKNENITINVCNGCFNKTATIKECAKDFSERRSKPYDNFIFIKGNRGDYAK